VTRPEQQRLLKDPVPDEVRTGFGNDRISTFSIE